VSEQRPRSRSRTRLDPAVRRRQIAEAAARVFAENDPSEVSFELIAEEAGVSRSLVYSYFGDRGSLFAAAYNHELEQLDVEIDAALGSLGSDRDRLGRAVSAYLGFAWRHRSSWQLIVSASSSRHPAVREAIQARTDRIAAAVADAPEARVLVSGVLGMLEAAAIHTLEHGDVDPDGLAELLTQIIWKGVSSLDGDGRRGPEGPPE
jgi:AcrR family transcriptional regulator